MSYWHAWIEKLDEGIRLLELRRYRRIMTAGRLPVVFTFGIHLLAWMLVPFLFTSGGVLGGRVPIDQHRAWGAGVLLTTAALAAGLGGYLRAQHLWQQERQLRTIHTWLLSYQDPRSAALTTVLMSALLGIALTAFPLVVGLVVGFLSGIGLAQATLYVLLLSACALAGAALGVAVFFGSHRMLARRYYYPGLAVLAVLALALWLHIENVESGWRGRWDEHPARIGKTVLLLTPIPVLFGVAAPRWWDGYAVPSLGYPLRSGPAALLYAAALLGAAAYAARAAVRGYLALAADPAQMETRPRPVVEEGGEEYYWKGFRNPVWTRDIRTRLRSKDTAEFLFFASIAVAAGAFVPLLMTASDLSDPLLTARAARQVFFWLTMTLVALVALVAPGLTADVVTQERALGTLEMLVGTPLRPREILMGKLLGAISVMLVLISPSLPLFGLCYLFHGASGPQVVQVYALLLVTLTVAALIGLAQSAINSKAGAAKFWAYSLTACFLALPGGPFWLAAAASAPAADMRQALAGQVPVAVLVGVIWSGVLLLFWGNACEQLEYSEY